MVVPGIAVFRIHQLAVPHDRHYMELLIRTCKRRNAPATTGMVPFVLSQLPPTLSKEAAIGRAKDGKRFEALAGSDGALVYDLALISHVQQAGSSISAAVVLVWRIHHDTCVGNCNRF